jgi:tRNA (cmo5U34)-methyltransferase
VARQLLLVGVAAGSSGSLLCGGAPKHDRLLAFAMSVPTSYRWNTSDFAVGYDAAAEAVHPHYRAIQDVILDLLPVPQDRPSLIVDLGGGSGRLMERILDRWPLARGVVVDQSEPFLALAERRLKRFGERGIFLLSRLQDDWPRQLPGAATALVSMSAIHHLDTAEKEALYGRCFESLVPGGMLLNGDEVRPPDDAGYLRELSAWAEHMSRGMEAGAIPPIFHSALEDWIDRNVICFGQPKRSGDDCHDTIENQLFYLRSAGFATADCPWQRNLWAVLRGESQAQ